MSRFHHPKGDMPEDIQALMGQLIVFILKEVLTIENKYGYKVPFLTS